MFARGVPYMTMWISTVAHLGIAEVVFAASSTYQSSPVQVPSSRTSFSPYDSRYYSPQARLLCPSGSELSTNYVVCMTRVYRRWATAESTRLRL
ncbi:uncharacterized protein B0H18DRAFT_1030307, partial [Fomitopsis serialis]|uniref:uncharacterized protein n=1 Tax=Fomitopsis serialis TaxID=139415 RepID=UPI0020081981